MEPRPGKTFCQSRVLRVGTKVLVLGSIYALTAVMTGAGIVDDAYVFLRYARNIWTGAGPVFNVGQRVEGYTSPLWLSVLTILRPVPLAPELLAVAASAVAGFALVLLVVFWRRSTDHDSQLLGGVFLASNPAFVYWAWSGMDTAIFALLVALTMVVFERDLRCKRLPIRTGVALSFATLARLEALWLIPVIAAVVTGNRRNIKSLAGVVGGVAVPLLATIGPHFLWRHMYYDAWLPNTFYAKLGIPQSALITHGVIYLWRSAPLTIPLLLLGALALRGARQQPGQHTVIFVGSAVWWLVYVTLAGGDHFPLYRFMIPTVALAAIFVGSSLSTLIGVGSRRESSAIGVIVLILANLLLLTTNDAALARAEVFQTTAWARTGQWCASELPDGTIATLVIGAIPFYCNREIYDLVGLVDPYVARQGRVHPEAAVGHQKWATDYILSKAPTYIFFPSSGVVRGPTVETVASRYRLPARTHQALIELVTRPETISRYEYRAYRMPDGFWVELLQRRKN